MKLIVGLGNPGPKYQLTRHNIGFMVIDAMAQDRGRFRQEHKAEILKSKIKDTPILLAKPQTFMNLSGESVRSIMDFYKIELRDLLVVHDEVDLPFATLRFQIRRGHGGHNGVKSVHQHLGSDDYARLKLGVGRPLDPRFEVADYVLGQFDDSQYSLLPEFLSKSVEAVEFFVLNGIERSANQFNSK